MPRGPATAALAALLAGCAAAPSSRLTWRETWDLVAATDDGLLIEARVVHTNTGLLRGQADLWVTLFPPRESTVVLHRTAPPQLVVYEPDTGSLRLAQDRLVEEAGTWTLHVREGEQALDATVHLAARAPAIPPVTLVAGARQDLVGAPVPAGTISGAWRAGEQGGLLHGRGALIRESADTWPAARPAPTSVHLFGSGHDAVVRIVAGRALAWVHGPEGLRRGEAADLRWEGDRLRVDLAPLPASAAIRLARRTVRIEPWDRLLPFERLLARAAAGWPERIFERGLGELAVDGRSEPVTALVIHGGR